MNKSAVADVCLPAIAVRINMMNLSFGPKHSSIAALALLVVSRVDNISLQIVEPALRV